MLRMARTIASANYLRDGGIARQKDVVHHLLGVREWVLGEGVSNKCEHNDLYKEDTAKTDFFRNSATHCEVTRITWAISYKEEW